METTLTLRPALPADRGHLLECYITSHNAILSMPPGIRNRVGEGQFIAQEAHYRTHFPAALRQIVVSPSGESIGMLWTDARNEEIRILDFTILPAHRGTGAGSEILRHLRSVAGELPLSLHVEIAGGHAPFFGKRGFAIKEEFPSTVLMEQSAEAELTQTGR